MHKAGGVLLVVLGLGQGARADLTAGTKAVAQGRADEAVRLLQAELSARPDDAKAHELLCRVYYTEEMADAAVRECEQAVAQGGAADSETEMWLGKAFGMKAAAAGPFAGLGLAKKVRMAFERAVQLDGRNVPAMVALGEFYTAAPALVGGGTDKAEHLAGQLEAVSPMYGHRLRAMVAEKKKDNAKAETELKAAVAQGNRPEAWVDLGAFYQRQREPEKMMAALQAATEADRARDASLMDVASVLHDAKASPEMAEKVLRSYLASSNKSEAAPAFKVQVQLGRLLASKGDAAGAKREYEAALGLAAGYAPARRALEGK